MARLKPSGVRLSRWRAQIRERSEAADMRPPHGRPAGTARMAASATAAPRRNTHRAPARKCTRLHGPLEGWMKERRKTGNGRIYVVFYSPAGAKFASAAAALRWVVASAA